MLKNDIGAILIAAGLVTKDEYEAHRAQAAQAGQSVIAYMLAQNYVTPEALAQAYASYMHVPFVEKVTDKMTDINVLGKIPLKFLRENTVMPALVEDKLTILTANPMQFQPLDELNLLLGGNVPFAVSTPKIIIDAINKYYPLEGTKQMIEELAEEKTGLEEVEFTDIDERDIVGQQAEAPVIKLINHILYQAVKQNASDIHIEPYEKELSVRYRIDGKLYIVMSPPKRIQDALISRIKIMANLNIAEKRIPQDGRIDLRIAGKPVDIRVSILPVQFGERVVMRILDKSRSFSRLQDMDFSKRDYQVIMAAINRPNGIIYVTGPTGSGKTSTLYAVLAELNKPDVNIITVEDPVEYQMKGVSQVQVRTKIGMTFAAALRSILRQDPDIVMIGETRDQETAQIAIQAALTGHLVLSTLHTNNAPASITRLLDMGVEPYLLASSVELAMAQRLVRRLCPLCKKVYKPSASELKSIGLDEKQAAAITFYKPVGCDECANTGYKGRLAIFEMMQMTPEIAKLTMERANTTLLRQQAIKDGMTLLAQDGLRKVIEGLTTIEEVLSVATLDGEAEEIEV
jgi:general secretion pathway protein E